MLTNDGRMWHLDFGYILGKNPTLKRKIAPQIRMSKAMVLGLGGQYSPGYREFVSKTIDAFLYLRNHRNLIMNLMSLMIDSSIENLPKAEAEELLSQMNERFLPHLSDEQARETFEKIIHDSVNNLFAEPIELFHRLGGFYGSIKNSYAEKIELAHSRFRNSFSENNDV